MAGFLLTEGEFRKPVSPQLGTFTGLSDVLAPRFRHCANRCNQPMKGFGRVVLGSVVGSLIGAVSFFVIDGMVPTNAAPIYLNCHETKLIKNFHELSTAGIDSSPTTSSNLWKDISIMILPEQGTGRVWDKEYPLIVHPDKYELKISISSVAMEYPMKTEVTTWTINRNTLEMEYKNSGFSSTKLSFASGYQTSKSGRETLGICKLLPSPVNNQI